MKSMKDMPFGRQVAKARQRYDRTGEALAAVERFVSLGDAAGAQRAAFELAFQGEKLALQLRLLPVASGKQNEQSKLERQITNAMSIRVGVTKEGWFGVSLPALLPKKEKGSPEYIRQGLYLALAEYFRWHERIRYYDCVLVIRHVYDRKRPERQWRDHDNIEVNAVVDAAALFVLRDDGAKCCSHFYCSTAGEVDETHLLVIPKPDFGMFYPNAENSVLPLL